MKVLICDFDLFNKIGGGQTFYRSLIEKHPQIDFYYLIRSESLAAIRPSNAYTVVYQEQYHIGDMKRFLDLTPPKWVYRAFTIANNIASSVTGQRFDVVDLPDYEQIGVMIQPALKYHHVDCDRIILSMHGKLSTSIKLDWFNGGQVDQTLVRQENIQYSVVDHRYGISKTYLDEWRLVNDLKSSYLNPLSIISLPQPRMSEPANIQPILNFIGRKEKLKGPDIFVDIAWWLPHDKFSQANIIGPDSFDPDGVVSSGDFIYPIINNRLKNHVALLPSMTYDELQKTFYSKSVTIIPSRYDTFNLIAIESLFSGCPTAIGSGAGVVRFLQEAYPHIPFITIDVNNIYASIVPLSSLLDNYDDYRYQLVEALSQPRPELFGSSVESIYNSQPNFDQDLRTEIENWYDQLSKLHQRTEFSRNYPKLYLKKSILKLINYPELQTEAKQVPEAKQVLKNLRFLVKHPKTVLKNRFLSVLSKDNYEGLKTLSLWEKYRNIFNLGESDDQQLSEKLQSCWHLSSKHRTDRVRIWREIARLELLRGNDIVAATYQLRGMRSLGYDYFGDLKTIIPILQENGFDREAITAEAMYSKSPDQQEKSQAILNQALSENKLNRNWDYEFLDDRRRSSTYQVSIIVSLYNAAAKLPLFLHTLEYQTLIKAGVAEIVLVDSGSPTDEYSVFKQIMEHSDMPVVYARCAQRETIQSAWNRGIDLAHSPYLTFLGVDETILPECLEILAGELDADPALDWVQANSLVTNVDPKGLWVNDVMVYNRQDYQQDFVYLETCYLSWVGALYRRSIHQRFGYYDASFKAAGDTEFKNRVLPFIKTKALPQILGVFRNYPDERTTQHPRAEIEDLRAWYLHRTLAGIEYAFANRDHQEAEKLFLTCLRYRKSYCQHWSTDIEYAYNVGRFLQQKIPNSPALQYFPGIKKLLDGYQSLDWIPELAKLSPTIILFQTNRLIKKIAEQHQAINHPAVKPMYKIFNDNRHEQHCYLWLTDI